MTVIGMAAVSAAFLAAMTLMILSRSAISTDAGGRDLFLGRNRQRTCGFGDRLRVGLLRALGRDDDRGFLRDDLQVTICFGGPAFDREIGFDLLGFTVLGRFDLLVGDRQFLPDAIFGFVLHRGLFDLRGLGAHRGRLVGDVALLVSSASRLVRSMVSVRLPRHQVLLRDRDLGGAHDLVALLLALLGDLGQRRQTVRRRRNCSD